MINFDDLTQGDPSWPQTEENAVTNEYLSQGLLVEDGYLGVYSTSYADAPSSPNYLFGGNFLTFTFVDLSPVYVSMRIHSLFDYANILHFYNGDNLLTRIVTSGATGTRPNRPLVPWELFSVRAASGITHITLEGFYNRPWGAMVDDLTYEYAKVTEPSILLIFCIGLVGVVARGVGYSSSNTKKRSLEQKYSS